MQPIQSRFSFFCRTSLLCSIVLIAACCKDNAPQPQAPKQYACAQDLTEEQIRYPVGQKETYDPRGVYCVNTPFAIFLRGYSPSPPFYARFNPTSNTGSGRLIIEGADSIKGTWRTENLKLDLKGVHAFMDYNNPPIYTFDFGGVNGEDFQDFLAPGGTWEKGLSFPLYLRFYNKNGKYKEIDYSAYANQIVVIVHSEVDAAGLIRGDKLICDYYLCFKRAVEQ